MANAHRTVTRTRIRTSDWTQCSLSTGMQRSRCPIVLVLLLLLLCTHRVSSQPDSDQDHHQNQDLDQDLNLDLRQRRLIQRARSARLLSQDWPKRAVEDLLAQMSLPETRHDAEPVSTVTGGRRNLERSVDANANNLPPRERKAGCKNFYWKGFTSC